MSAIRNLQNVVTSQELQGMVSHWLSTPPNGYFGSSYGADLFALLQSPMSMGLADALIEKLRTDVPIIGALPAGSVNIYVSDVSNDEKSIFIEVLDQLISIDTTKLRLPR